MSDNMSREKRSMTMSRIRSKGNASTELKMVELLEQNQIQGWWRHPNITGKPDLVFIQQKVAVFIDGCFWHGCPRCFQLPKSNVDYWLNKIARNKKRAKEVNKKLKQDGWIVLRIWEHAFKRPGSIIKRINKVLSQRNTSMMVAEGVSLCECSKCTSKGYSS